MTPLYKGMATEPPDPRLHGDTYVSPLIKVDKSGPGGTLFQVAFAASVFLLYRAYEGSISWLAAIACGVLAFIIAAAVILTLSWRNERFGVTIFKDGLIFRSDDGPLAKTKSWWLLPWSSIVHIDLRSGAFAVQHTGIPGSQSPGYLQMISVDRVTRKWIVEQIESFQHRGDIPKNFRILS